MKIMRTIKQQKNKRLTVSKITTILLLISLVFISIGIAYMKRGYWAGGGELCIIPLAIFIYEAYKKAHEKEKN